MGEWDIEFKRRQDAAFEKAQAHLRWLVEQEQLRAGKATPINVVEVHSTEKNEAEPKARRKKTAEAFERAKQAIKSKCSNGPLALSKRERNSLCEKLGVSPSTIDRVLRELRDERQITSNNI